MNKTVKALLGVLGMSSLMVGAFSGGWVPTTEASGISSHGGKSGKSQTVPYFKHIFVIMYENHSYADLMDEHDVPYIHYLAGHYGLATQAYGVTNPTVPDRVSLFSGQGRYLTDSVKPGSLTYPNLIDQLTSHHLSWDAFYQHTGNSSFAHPVYPFQTNSTTLQLFKDIANNPQRLSHLQPLRNLKADLASGQVPNFTWISPNFSLNNMHGGFRIQGAGAGAIRKDSNIERAGDSFLRKWVSRIMRSPAWKSGPSMIVFTYDETSFDASKPQNGLWASHAGVIGSPFVPKGTVLEYSSKEFPFAGGLNGGGHIVTLVITNPPRHVVSNTPYNEFSILRTIEKGWHLPYLGHAAQKGVHSMKAFFHGSSVPSPQHAEQTGNLAGYSQTYHNTPIVQAGRSWVGGAASTQGVVDPTSDPYFTEAMRHQAGAELQITPASGSLVYPHTIRLTLPSHSVVTFAQHSNPVAATSRIPNPGMKALTPRYGPATISPHHVVIPTSPVSGTVPASAIIGGLLMNVPPGAPAGPVSAMVSVGGIDIRKVILGTVGRPAPAFAPRMLAPVVNPGHVLIRFVAPRHTTHGRYRIEIEGVHPTTTSTTCQCMDTNQFFSAVTTANTVSVTNAQAGLTPLAGKEYWVRVVDLSQSSNGPNARVWSRSATFTALR